MPSEVALGAIYVALKALMAAYVPLTGLIAVKTLGVNVPAIYDEGAVPQSSAMPYLTIGAGTQVPWHTMGMANMARWGWNCTVQIKAIGQGTEASGLAIMSQVAAVLYGGRELSLAGYGSSFIDDEFTVQPTIVTTLAGVTTREWPAILRVYCHDTL
jgi:uncharacterized protein DUF3168